MSATTIPPLTPDGVLPPGVHPCTLDEIERAFAAREARPRRRELFGKLKSLVVMLKESGLFCSLYVDGSFATAKPDPGDLDLICEFKQGHDFDREIDRQVEYQVLKRSDLKRRFECDLFHVPFESASLSKHIELFSQVRDREDITKGLLRVAL